ncbi:MAG: FG-GAP repeat domain-containing protein [Anaerolineae bacterium]
MPSGRVFSLRAAVRVLHALLLALSLVVLQPGVASGQIGAMAVEKGTWPLGGGNVVESSPTIADIDGDGVTEVLVGTTAQRGSSGGHQDPSQLVVYDGGFIYGVNAPGPIAGAPTVADIDGDGRQEIIVSIGGDVGDQDQHGMVIAYRYSAGAFSEVWRFRTQDWAPWVDGLSEGVFATPTVCNLDGDSRREIAFGAWDQHFYVLNADGTQRWSYYNADTIWSSMACADLNGDGRDELIGGADITGAGILPDGTHTQNGGFVYVFNSVGNVLVRRFVPEAVYSSPAVGDLDRDGSQEIVVGTSWYWWGEAVRAGQNPPAPNVYAFSTANVFGSLPYADPTKLPVLPGWPRLTDYPGFSSPALADLDGDGDLEVIIGTGDPYNSGPDGFPGAGSVYAWHHTGALVSGWPVTPTNMQGNNSFVRSSPTVGDVDGDGAQEVVFSMAWDVQVYGPTGAREAVLRTNWTVVASPAIGDVDGDGHGELWIGGGDTYDQTRGYLWRFEFTDGNLGHCDWPQFHHDAAHTGASPAPARLTSGLYRIWLLVPSGGGSSGTTYINLQNSGGFPLTWYSGQLPYGVRLAPTTGALGSRSYQDVEVLVTQLATGPGLQDLGNIVISYSSSTGQGTVSVQLRVLVGNASSVHLPLVLR